MLLKEILLNLTKGTILTDIITLIPPYGYVFVLDKNNAYVKDKDGNYLITRRGADNATG